MRSERIEWKVYACAPRKDGREGKNYTLKATPPPELARHGVEPLRRTSGQETRAAAQEEADAWARTLNASVLPVGPRVEVLELLEKHRDWRAAGGEPTAEGTVVAYTQALRRLREPLQGVRADQLTRGVLLTARDAVARSVGPGTTNQTFNCLRHAWRWALERDLIVTPWPAVKRLKVPPTEQRDYTDEEVVAVLGWVRANRPHWVPLFELLADVGCRISEALALRGRDVDRAAGHVRIGRSKTGPGRVLRPTRETLALLPAAIEGELVFRAKRPACRSDRPVGRRVPLGVLWDALEALELPDREHLDLHSFRRSWIVVAHEQGVPLNVSMRATGHTTPAVHLAYARKATHDVAGAVESVAQRRRKARKVPQEGHTAPHRTGSGPIAEPKSSAGPPESPIRESC